MTEFEPLLRALAEGGIEFVVVGGVAASAHGSARLTQDLDIVYGRSRENTRRLAAALAAFEPYLRGAPPGLPFRLDADTLWSGLNFTLRTTAGDIDLLGEIAGGGTYDSLLPDSEWIDLFGANCRLLGLDRLIEVKRAAGRPKDLEAIAELEALREERRRGGQT